MTSLRILLATSLFYIGLIHNSYCQDNNLPEKGWKITFENNEYPEMGGNSTIANLIVNNINATGTKGQAGYFICMISNYGKYNFQTFSMETNNGEVFELARDPQTNKALLVPEVLSAEKDKIYFKFKGTVKNDNKLVEIQGYLKNY